MRRKSLSWEEISTGVDLSSAVLGIETKQGLPEEVQRRGSALHKKGQKSIY